MITTTLDNLDEGLKKKKFMDMATFIVKYQKFKTSVAVEKMKDIDIANTTKSSYFSLGCSYLKTKERKRTMPPILYKCIDEVVNKCIQPLTPSIEEERKIKKQNYTKKEALPPVAKLDIVKQPISTNNIEYGVKSGNTIMLMPNREYALGFLAGLKNLNKEKEIDAKVVTVEIGDINEND